MNSLKIEEIQYLDFSKHFHRKMGMKRIPIVGQMELTFRCNLKCVHCYVTKDRTKPELSLQETADIIDKICQEGCLWLSFTGGEPLMRSDFLEIYHYAKKKGLLITLLTNGTLMTQEIAEFLADEPPFSINLTLNGITQKTYENISQVPGSFKKAMKAIELILDKKLSLKIKTKATRLNYHELEKIRKFVEDLGLDFNLNAMLYPRLDGSLEPCRFRLSPDEITCLDRLFQDDKECQVNDLKEESSIPPDNLFRCAAGLYSFHISPYGELTFCTFMRQPNFNLVKGSFKKGFSALFPKIRSLKYRTHSQCRNCKIFYLCAQCPALAMLENGDMEKPVEYFCQLAHKQEQQQKEAVIKPQRQIHKTAE
ncbi:MAG: radical SAM protein [Candidatus Aminicenantaceae bacterium]